MADNRKAKLEALVERLRAGDPRALGRALTIVENGGAAAMALTEALSGSFGKALIVGFTGPPGAGKSTLVDTLIHEWRREGRSVAVLAVDPVSPVSGGAVLGDRTRMGAHSLDDGVFIRSVSARGHLGGWISNPQGIKPGNQMPSVSLDGEELQALLDYLQTLE